LNRVVTIFFFTACSLLFSAAERDSVYFEYSDFGNYDVMSTRLNFSQNDSLSSINLTGVNTRTDYEKYSKSDIGVNGDISVRHGFMKYGIILSNDYIANSSISRPTQNNIRILPMTGYEKNGLTLRAAFGYLGKTDEVAQRTGSILMLDGAYGNKHPESNISVNSSFSGDDTDDSYNYSSNSDVFYFRRFGDRSAEFSAGGRGNFNRYHFSDLSSDAYMIRRYEYDVFSTLFYIPSANLRNKTEVSFFSRNRDSFREGDKIGFNANSNLRITDEIYFDRESLGLNLKADFDTGSDRFSVGYDEADRSLSYYNIALSPGVNYRYRNYIFKAYGRFVKHEYKSLTSSNLEDRDIIKLSFTPEAVYTRSGNLTLSQSFPLEYYKLVNISYTRSINNYTDRAVNSITDIRYDISDNLYLTGNLKFRTYYRSYDYDDTYSNSFVIKNYSVSDTISYNISKKIVSKLSTRYIFEEFGNFNYGDFTENPINFKNHYYTSASFYFNILKYINLRSEYFFYEIDSYEFDQENFDRHDLTRVYISHGPKIGMEYRKKNFFIFSGLEVENYRLSERQVKFRLESYLSFN